MQALANIRVGSFLGRIPELGTTTCPRSSKYFRNRARISVPVISSLNIPEKCTLLPRSSQNSHYRGNGKPLALEKTYHTTFFLVAGTGKQKTAETTL
jgi:hypothetical protein